MQNKGFARIPLFQLKEMSSVKIVSGKARYVFVVKLAFLFFVNDSAGQGERD
jgi:hypothetical protein